MRLADLGVIEPREGKHRVRISYRDGQDTTQHIYGLRRRDEQHAQEDFKSMRAAAGNASVVEDRQAAFVSVARVATELRGTVADERSVVQWEAPAEAFLREAERKLNVNDIVVMAQPMPYKFSSVGCVDADEPWQRNLKKIVSLLQDPLADEHIQMVELQHQADIDAQLTFLVYAALLTRLRTAAKPEGLHGRL